MSFVPHPAHDDEARIMEGSTAPVYRAQVSVFCKAIVLRGRSDPDLQDRRVPSHYKYRTHRRSSLSYGYPLKPTS